MLQSEFYTISADITIIRHNERMHIHSTHSRIPSHTRTHTHNGREACFLSLLCVCAWHKSWANSRSDEKGSTTRHRQQIHSAPRQTVDSRNRQTEPVLTHAQHAVNNLWERAWHLASQSWTPCYHPCLPPLVNKRNSGRFLHLNVRNLLPAQVQKNANNKKVLTAEEHK